MRAILTVLRRHNAIVVFLSAIFIARLFLADWNSYWSDELLSVAVYGVWNDDLVAMVSHLADNSIHPPLYQIVLYLWMSVFGDSEVATRALSDLNMTVAAAFLYAIVTRSHGRLVAFFGAAGFSLMSWTMYYGLESRSYAQTALLVTVSSWALLRFLDGTRSGEPWRSRAQLAVLAVLAVANTGLMLTHYYNAFWIVAQGVFFALFVIRERRLISWPGALTVLSLIGIVPVGVFFAAWGRVFIAQYQSRADDYVVEGGSASLNPVQLLAGTIVRSNLDMPTVLILASALLIAAAVVVAGVRIIRPSRSVQNSDWVTLYLASWLVLPLAVTYLAFTVMGVERYSARYFIFSAPPLVPLLVIAIAWFVRLLGRGHPAVMPVTAAASALALVVAVVPGGLAAAQDRKDDWRGITKRLVQTIHQDPGHRYTIIETGFGGESRARFYLEQFSPDIRAEIFTSRNQETAGDYSAPEAQFPQSDESDFVVVLYLHLREPNLPLLSAVLDEHYDEHYRQLDSQGRGFVVYRVDSSTAAPTGPVG